MSPLRDRIVRAARRLPAGALGAAVLVLTACPAPEVGLLSLSVTPAQASVAGGTSQRFTALAGWSDGAVEDVTATSEWSVGTPAVARLSTEPAEPGLVLGLAAGDTEVVAAFGGLRATARLTVTAAELKSIVVTPSEPTLGAGTTRAFVATGRFADDSSRELVTGVEWTVSDPTVATVSNEPGTRGVVTALRRGLVRVTATSGEVTGSTEVTVTEGELRSVALTPATVSVVKGRRTALVATGTYADGSTTDVTTGAAWRSADPTVATVGDEPGSVLAIGVGEVELSATFGGKLGRAVVTVTPATLTSLAVTPATLSLAKGLTATVTVAGTYSDTTTRDVTGATTWTSSDDAVATVSAAGLVTAVAVGTATLTATVGDASTTAVVTVGPAALVSVAAAPPTATVALGRTRVFTLGASYTDGSVRDVTAAATWSAANESIATVGGGVATGVALGSTTLRATFEGLVGESVVTVTGPEVDSLALTPAAPSLAAGLTVALTASATYSDGVVRDVSAVALWTSADEAVATVSPVGLVTALAPGTSVISAFYAGMSATAVVAVTPAELRSITIAPATPTLAAGRAQALVATGTYTGGATEDLSAVATWTSSNDLVATVSAAGRVTAVGVGTAAITATRGTIDATITVVVTAAVLDSIALTPAAPSLVAGESVTIAAVGTWSDGSTAALSGLVAWSSSLEAVATVSAAGTVTAVAGGVTTLTATLDGISASAEVTVTASPIVSLALVPGTASVPVGATRALEARATRANGSTSVVSTEAAWSTSAPGVATVSSPGVVSAVAVGEATIAAELEGIHATAVVTVTPPALRSLTLAPATVSLAAGLTGALTATGTYTDESSADLSSRVTWDSSDDGVATVSATGVVTAVATGSATVTAILDGVTGSAAVAVTPATVVSLAVTPDGASLEETETLALTATGTYTDGSSRDDTRVVL